MAPRKRDFPRVQIVLRLEPDMLDQIDAWAAGLASDNWPPPSRNEIITQAIARFFEGQVGFSMPRENSADK